MILRKNKCFINFLSPFQGSNFWYFLEIAIFMKIGYLYVKFKGWSLLIIVWDSSVLNSRGYKLSKTPQLFALMILQTWMTTQQRYVLFQLKISIFKTVFEIFQNGNFGEYYVENQCNKGILDMKPYIFSIFRFSKLYIEKKNHKKISWSPYT